jgi:hypothetical protein
LIFLPLPQILALPVTQVQAPHRWQSGTRAPGTGWIHHHRRSLSGKVASTGTTAVRWGPLETDQVQSPWFALDLYSGGSQLEIWLGYRPKAHPRGKGGCRAAALPNPQKLKFKERRFCRYDIKSFMWFSLQPISTTEIGWWLVH